MTTELPQGPKIGSKGQSEAEPYTDPNTGARVKRLTTLPGARDHHLYDDEKARTARLYEDIEAFETLEACVGSATEEAVLGIQ